ncbi:MAG TPA: hypothetical protein VE999_05890 [Gemmataceae bacterium]|nr:hypothetical protein [Gemmataceae bacterium]
MGVIESQSNDMIGKPDADPLEAIGDCQGEVAAVGAELGLFQTCPIGKQDDARIAEGFAASARHQESSRDAPAQGSNETIEPEASRGGLGAIARNQRIDVGAARAAGKDRQGRPLEFAKLNGWRWAKIFGQFSPGLEEHNFMTRLGEGGGKLRKAM